MISNKVVLLAIAVFSTRIRQLIGQVNQTSLRFFILQAALLSLNKFVNLPIYRLSEFTTVAAAVSSLLFSYVFKGDLLNGISSLVCHSVLALGAVPSLSSALDVFWKSNKSPMNEDADEDIDIPALLAMELGLLLGHIRSSLVILVMLTGGEALESYALQRAKKNLTELLNASPSIAHKFDPSSLGTIDVSVDEVKPGDFLLVKSDEMIAVDGRVQSKNLKVDIDEQMLTGEITFAQKIFGDKVISGCFNRSDIAFEMIAEKLWKDSLLSRMQLQVRESLESKSKMELDSMKQSDLFFNFTIFLATGSYLFQKLILKKNENICWNTVLSVLMAATPCPLQIGVPVAFLSGMSILTKRFKCSVRSADAVEKLAGVDTIVFDKTGTVTEGKPVVEKILIEINQCNLSVERIAQLLASLEFHSVHPLAKAVSDYNAKIGDGQLLKTRNVAQTQGRGLDGEVLMSDSGYFRVEIGSIEPSSAARRDKINNDEVFLTSCFCISSFDGEFTKGEIHFQDNIREGAAEMIQKLKQLRKRLIIMSGDRSNHLAKVSESLQIAEFKSCWPHEKALEVKKLQAEGLKVLMVGDGVNDSAALLAADVGIAVGANGLAAKAADIVLLKEEELARLPEIIVSCQHVVKVAKNTVQLGMTLSCAQMLLAAGGILTPFVSASMQEVVDLSTVLYSFTAFSI